MRGRVLEEEERGPWKQAVIVFLNTLMRLHNQ